VLSLSACLGGKIARFAVGESVLLVFDSSLGTSTATGIATATRVLPTGG